MELLLIRHGQTVHNEGGKHQGWFPVELSPLGINQAKQVHKNLQNQHFDRIIASDLHRTKQTAELIFCDRLDQIEYSSAIREIDTSVLYGHTYQETMAKYGEVYEKARKSLDYSFCGGESAQHFMERVSGYLKAFEDASNPQVVATVTHGGVISAMLAYLLNTKIEQVSDRFYVDNCGMSWIVYTQTGWRIKTWNC